MTAGRVKAVASDGRIVFALVIAPATKVALVATSCPASAVLLPLRTITTSESSLRLTDPLAANIIMSRRKQRADSGAAQVGLARRLLLLIKFFRFNSAIAEPPLS